MPSALPTLAALTASLLLGAVPYLAIALYRDGLDAPSLLFWRYWLALLLMLPLALRAGHDLKRAARAGGGVLFLNAALCGSAQTYLYFEAIRLIPSSLAVVIFYVYPAVTLLIERVAHGAALRPVAVVSTVLVLAGAILAAGPPETLGNLPWIGLACAAICPVFYSAYLLLATPPLKRLPALVGASFVYAGLGIGYLVVVAFVGLRVPAGLDGWGRMAAIAVFGGAIPIGLFAFSLPRLGPSGYGIVASSELLTVILIGVLLLGEPFGPAQAVGAALVIAGIVIYRRPKPTASPPLARREARASPG